MPTTRFHPRPAVPPLPPDEPPEIDEPGAPDPPPDPGIPYPVPDPGVPYPVPDPGAPPDPEPPRESTRGRAGRAAGGLPGNRARRPSPLRGGQPGAGPVASATVGGVGGQFSGQSGRRPVGGGGPPVPAGVGEPGGERIGRAA